MSFNNINNFFSSSLYSNNDDDNALYDLRSSFMAPSFEEPSHLLNFDPDDFQLDFGLHTPQETQIDPFDIDNKWPDPFASFDEPISTNSSAVSSTSSWNPQNQIQSTTSTNFVSGTPAQLNASNFAWISSVSEEDEDDNIPLNQLMPTKPEASSSFSKQQPSTLIPQSLLPKSTEIKITRPKKQKKKEPEIEQIILKSPSMTPHRARIIAEAAKAKKFYSENKEWNRIPNFLFSHRTSSDYDFQPFQDNELEAMRRHFSSLDRNQIILVTSLLTSAIELVTKRSKGKKGIDSTILFFAAPLTRGEWNECVLKVGTIPSELNDFLPLIPRFANSILPANYEHAEKMKKALLFNEKFTKLKEEKKTTKALSSELKWGVENHLQHSHKLLARNPLITPLCRYSCIPAVFVGKRGGPARVLGKVTFLYDSNGFLFGSYLGYDILHEKPIRNASHVFSENFKPKDNDYIEALDNRGMVLVFDSVVFDEKKDIINQVHGYQKEIKDPTIPAVTPAAPPSQVSRALSSASSSAPTAASLPTIAASVPGLPAQYIISDRYSAGTILAPKRGTNLPPPDKTSAENVKSHIIIRLQELGEGTKRNDYETFSFQIGDIASLKVHTLSGNPLEWNKNERLTFVFAGRKEKSIVPVETDGGRVILVCPASENNEEAKWLAPNRDVLAIESIPHFDTDKVGLLTCRRFAVFALMTQLQNPNYLVMDDNILGFFFSNKHGGDHPTWSTVYDLYVKLAKHGDLACASTRTQLTVYDKAESTELGFLEEKSIGSKIFFFDNKKMNSTFSIKNLHILFPLEPDVWGEDVWMWRMLLYAGLRARVALPELLQLKRSLKVFGSFAATVNGARFWLSKKAEERYTKLSELQKLVYQDVRRIAQRDYDNRTGDLKAIDSYQDVERTKARLELFEPLAKNYNELAMLFYNGTDEKKLSKTLRKNNGNFRIPKVNNYFFYRLNQELNSQWEMSVGLTKAYADNDAKIRLAVEVVKHSRIPFDVFEQGFANWVSGENQANRTVSPIMSGFMELAKLEIPLSYPQSAGTPASDASLQSFLKMKKCELDSDILEGLEYRSQTITFHMEINDTTVTLTPSLFDFDAHGRAVAVHAAEHVSVMNLFTEMKIAVKWNGAAIVIDSAVETQKFLTYITQFGMKVNNTPFLLIPGEGLSQSSLGKRRSEYEFDLDNPKRLRMDDDEEPTPATQAERDVSTASTSSKTTEVSRKRKMSGAAQKSSKKQEEEQPTAVQPALFNLKGLGFLQESLENLLNSALRSTIQTLANFTDIKEAVSNLSYAYPSTLATLTDDEKGVRIAKLKNYQVESIHAARSAWKSNMRGIILGNDMGTGKTLIMAELILERLERGEKVLFLAPDTILAQTCAVFQQEVAEAILGQIENALSRRDITEDFKYFLKDRLNKILSSLERASDENFKSSFRIRAQNILNLIQTNGSTVADIAPFLQLLGNQLILVNPFTEIQIQKSISGKLRPRVILARPEAEKESNNVFVPALILVDEASRIHNPAVAAYKNLMSFLNPENPSPHLVLSTGTPIENRLDEFSALLQLLQTNSQIGYSKVAEDSRHAFEQSARAALSKLERNPDSVTLANVLTCALKSFISEEFFIHLTRPLIYRVNKREEKVRNAWGGQVPIERRIRTEITLAPEHAVALCGKYEADGGSVLKTVPKLNLCRLHPNFLAWYDMNSNEYTPLAEQLSANLISMSDTDFDAFVSQSPFLARYMSDLDTIQQPIVDVVEHLAVGHILTGVVARKLGGKHKVRFLSGETSGKKNEIINSFQSGNVPVLIMMRATGGVGLDFKNAKTLRLVEKFWNPGEQKQAEARISRVGVEGVITIIDYDSKTDAEQHIRTTQETKELLTSIVLGEKEKEDGSISIDRTPLNRLNVRSRLETFLRYLCKKPYRSTERVPEAQTKQAIDSLLNVAEYDKIVEIFNCSKKQ